MQLFMETDLHKGSGDLDDNAKDWNPAWGPEPLREV